MVFESTFYKGHSSNKKLNGIVFRIRLVEKEVGCVVHVIHIPGTRMKHAGIDGLSQGDFLEGIMKVNNPLDHIPLNEDAFSRSQRRVLEWVTSWWTATNGDPWFGASLRLLQPKDWFSLHEIGTPRL